MKSILSVIAIVIAIATCAVRAAEPPDKPAETVSPPADVKTQRVPFLGTATTQATAAQHAAAGLPPGVGLFVQHVLRGSPAEAAGIERGDILHKLDDQVLINDPQFRVLLRLYKPGDDIHLVAVRDGKSRPFTLKLGAKEVPAGDVPAGELLHWLLRPASADAAATAGFSATYEDAEHILALTTDSDGKRLVAKDKRGAVLFDGPVNTRAERESVPAAIVGKLKQLETPPKPQSHETQEQRR